MAKSELEKYKETVAAQLSGLSSLLPNYALGDFSESIEIPEEENEFTELLVGLSLMVDDIREMIREKDDTITELEQAEEALRESEKKFSKLFHSNPAGMVITTLKDGKCIEVNDSFTHSTGYRSEEALGRTSIELGFWTRPKDRDEVTQKLRQHGAFRDLEFEFRNKSGQIRMGSFSVEVIKLQDEPCIVTAINDITERRRAEEALARRVEELERFNRLAVGRELRMIELKRQINELSEQLGKELPYDLSFVG
jgi:PAS domain S-box-containing protein